MTPKYVLRDGNGKTGQVLSFTQGETVEVTGYLFAESGCPFLLTDPITELEADIYVSTSAGPIVKKLSLATTAQAHIIAENGGQGSVLIGFKFVLTEAETLTMVPNSAGLPMTVIATTANIKLIFDFVSAFDVSVPVIVVA